MGAIENPQHEKFTQVWHATNNKTEAYRQAYPNRADKWKPETINNKASALSRTDEVKARYAELQQATAQKHQTTVEDLIKELDENRRVALSAETPQTSAANSATLGKARLLGLDVQKVEHSGSIPLTIILDQDDED